jgi:voltage-gated potassium channel Kch
MRLRGRVGIYVAGGASLLAFCAALAVLDAERSSVDANITDFGDAIWWAVTTMTTVGYGDHYPVTPAGRLVAFGLMIGGIALLGTVTATLASWLVETVAAEKSRPRTYRSRSGGWRTRSTDSPQRAESGLSIRMRILITTTRMLFRHRLGLGRRGRNR